MTTQTQTASPPTTNGRHSYRVIDTDIHHTIGDWSDLQPYLAEPWRSKIMRANSRVGGLGPAAPSGPAPSQDRLAKMRQAPRKFRSIRADSAKCLLSNQFSSGRIWFMPRLRVGRNMARDVAPAPERQLEGDARCAEFLS